MISVIIPSFKDPYLQNTINSLLKHAEDDIEIIVVLDGYWPTNYDWSDKRIKIVHLGKTRGMREAINAGVLVSTGEFIMRTDEHCEFGPGYDRLLTEVFEDNWIVYPKRFYLNPETWTVMDIKPNVYNKLVIDETHGKFSGLNWKARELQNAHLDIDESMAMQGSCWIMKRSWWDSVIGRLQTEGYGPLYQDSHEMVFKTWKAGGKLMVNKKTWHAHKHRSFNRTHNYGTAEAKPGWDYALNLWGDYYKQIKQQWGI